MPEIGQNLSHYTLVGKIGKGGMGVVYQAKDQKLGRDVAIKVLPEEFAKDADRVARFQREAKLLASLNHPNIASIYGLEESDGTHFLVLELVEGDTLAARIKKGSIPVEEALKLALQIAEALEAAHEKGVIHRDLKPANIKVTPDGKVKVLDFGLAKAFAGDQGEMILSDSPTLSVAATQQGIIFGTAAYMSPEQARGNPVDKRTDIWAFGVVLFEMLTGRQIFSENTVSDTLASVLKIEPDWQNLPPNLHPRIRFLLERCLKKESKNRYSGISDARVEIQEVLADPSGVFVQPVAGVEPQARLRIILPWVAAALVLGLIIAGVIVWKLKPTEPRQVMRFDYELPEGQQLGALAVSPDGNQFVYSTTKGLYMRSVDELDARLIPGTDESPQGVAFSPDGQWILYYASNDRQLKKISISGGAPVALCEVQTLINIGKWYADDTIVYAQWPEGIMQVSASGGTPKLLVAPEGYALTAPQLLPDGKSVLATFVNRLPIENAQIVVESLESGERKQLFAGRGAQYLSTGHMVYWLQDNLYAAPFDLDTLEVTGGPLPIVEGLINYAVSESGTLAYVPGTRSATTSPERRLAWVDREGQEELIELPPDNYHFPKISLDGTKAALTVTVDGNEDIYIWEPVSGNLRRLTFDKGRDSQPLWTPDTKRIVFMSDRGGKLGIYWKAADGTGEVEALSSAPDLNLYPWSWADDGSTLLTMQSPDDSTDWDIGTLSIEGDGIYETLMDEEYWVAHPRISPDGRYMAYMSVESGQQEIYVCPFPEVKGGKWQISTAEGASPLWSPDGRELFYLSPNGDAIMAALVNTEPTFSAGKPKTLFRGNYVAGFGEEPAWDIHTDGRRFLMMKEAASMDEASAAEAPRKINIVTNWFEELKERVPVK